MPETFEISHHSHKQIARICPRDRTHVYAIEITEVINGKTIITKECETCGQFISQTILPVARPIKQ